MGRPPVYPHTEPPEGFEEVPRTPPSKTVRKVGRPKSPRQVRTTVDRFGKPKQRWQRKRIFADGNDVVILKVSEKGLWQRLPEPTPTAPSSGVPRFTTRPAAIAWLRGQGASQLGGSQVCVVRLLEVMFLEVVNKPMVSLVRRPKFDVPSQQPATRPETALESTSENGG